MDLAEASDEPCARVKLKKRPAKVAGCQTFFMIDLMDTYVDNESSLPCLRWQHEP